MDCGHRFIMYEEKKCLVLWDMKVLIGHGTIEFVPDEDGFDALKILMAQYHEEDFKFNTDMMKVTTVFKVVVSDMTGKRRNNVH